MKQTELDIFEIGNIILSELNSKADFLILFQKQFKHYFLSPKPNLKPNHMFKQHNSTSSTLHMLGTSNAASQHSSLSKQSASQIQNFSKLLKKLETQNVNIDELRLLKTQHNYLEKLRNQRQKVQELKLKYTECEQQLSQTQEENKAQCMLLQEYEQTIEILKDQLEGQRERRLQLQSTIGNKLQTQKQKMKQKISELTKQIQDMKRMVKNKDILIMQLEEESEEKVKEMKEHFADSKKKLVFQIEERLSKQLEEKSQFENEVIELRNLVTRQNKALKQQNQKYQQLTQSHTKLVEELEKCHQQITNLTLACEEYEEKMGQVENNNQELLSSLKEMAHNQQNQGQLQELRKRMAEMAKGQIQKIQFIVNEFQ